MSFQSIQALSPGDQILFNRFGRGQTYPLAYDTVTAAFDAIVESYPYSTAVRECYGFERTITYAELDWRSNIIANHLIGDHGLQPGQRVVCVYSRCIEMCAFIFGVMKAGGQYVPIDGAVMVEESLEHVIRDSEAPIVLCLSNFREKVERSLPESSQARIVALDTVDPIWKKGDTRAPSVDIGPEDGAYVIYTSGTTGKPKGVDVKHEGTCNTLLNEPSKLGITVGTNVACVLMLGFDMCAWEILGTLMNGGTLNLRGPSRPGGDREVWNTCLSRVDVVITTPSGAQKYLPRQAEYPNVKTIAVGGEPCPLSLADEWAPHINFWNVCGPTEISILNTAHLHKVGTKLAIGKPNPNTNVYILDEEQNPVKIGEPGLMWVGGLGVSRGYLNSPKLTEERYKVDKFANDGRMMFNTGDLGRWLDNGTLEHLGRKDDQVKIKGCRVELDGVSSSIEKFPSVDKACALKIGEELWAFYSASGAVNETALQKHLATCLNHYARPSKLINMVVVPLTPGGKIDKKALKALAEEKLEASRQLTEKAASEKRLTNIVVSEKPMPVQTPPQYSKENELPGMNHFDITEKGLKDDTSSTNELMDGKEIELPQKKGWHGQRWLRHKGLNAYRKLFIFVFMINVFAFIGMIYGTVGGLPIDGLATAVAANLLASVAFRQDHVVNTVFWLATRWPTSAPLWIRRHFARCYHMGGIHSAGAVSATIWWIIFAVQSTMYFVNGSQIYPINAATVALTFVVLALFLAILVMSYPSIRMKMHDQFEWTHRFAGWTALVMVWAHIVVSTASISQASDQPLSLALSQSPAMWLVVFITLSIALPWMRLRQVNVIPEPLSNHAVRLHFDFCTPPPGRGIRITDSPLREWHAFATITEPGKAGFSIIVSRAGDWTGRIIENPPTKIWTRGSPASGVLRVAPLFKKIVLVATGSGIGPCMPVIMAGKVSCCVFWSTPNPEKTYGEIILKAVQATDAGSVIWNTRTQGRPNMALEAYKMYKESGAECVCVISNKVVTTKLIYDLETRGVPAFGPIWDS
ncbi:uncharacterized protein BCR38DRAFT_468373 [Pseudomassariella vexata]|uniref:AMP-dependent synthetase/ligase domain-containing protein n=1 Tax=Pseudomassariella vexata TaxID=1141098 RepID=A0A1Y2DIS3_9PEZI|nr:uncharacterized protein BCR38DRAFT_468373 [Pseudomassariella vexata]ORY59066.1 hypothetical protein BCR38DRAFT_468373 [Pseudomassariella vexata]